MALFRVTPRANHDLQNIGRYTEKRWGKLQRNKYLKNLENRFLWMATNSRIGKHRSDIAEGYFSFPEGEHVMFYVIGHIVGKECVYIIGIPHKEMDIMSYFAPG